MKDLAGDADISAVNEPVRYTRDAQGLPYGVLLVPLRDGAGDSLGVIAVARDFSGSRAAAGRSLIWQICLAHLCHRDPVRRGDRGGARLPAAPAGRPRPALRRASPRASGPRCWSDRQVLRRDSSAWRITASAERATRGAREHETRGVRARLLAAGALGQHAAAADQSADWTRGCRSGSRSAVAFVEIDGVQRERRHVQGDRRRPPALGGSRGCGGRRRRRPTRRGSTAAPRRRRNWPRSGCRTVELANQRGKAAYAAHGLRIYPDGRVELIRRTTAEFATAFDVERFPFDRQKLRIELAIRDRTADAVALEFEQDDLDFSRAAASATARRMGPGARDAAQRAAARLVRRDRTRASLASLEIARQSGGDRGGDLRAAVRLAADPAAWQSG